MSLLSIKNLEKSFGKNKVLKGINLDVSNGETIAIIGSSGSGKSTLLRCLTFLERAEKGEMILDSQQIIKQNDEGCSVYPTEQELNSIRLNFGLVFQNFNLFPHMSVINNLMLAPMLVNKSAKAAAEENARIILRQVGLADKENAYPYQLSGGQQQRAAIARALLMKPKILCFDEPTSALDPELTGEVLNLISSLRKTDTAMIIVTHELAFARDVADRIVFMDGGNIVEIGASKELFYEPKEARTKEFIRSIVNNTSTQ